MKNILVVGGGANQIPLIEASKREGYRVTVVDYAGEHCPAFGMVDRFYDVSTQDEEAIYEVAQNERIDGIISNSEASMLIVNRIAERLNLMGNPVDGINDLVSKSRFRELQRSVGVFSAHCQEVTTAEEAMAVAKRLRKSIIMKPDVSSGSRGCKKIDYLATNDVKATFETCSQYSRDRKVVVEEWVAMPSLQTIEGDVFVCDDSIIWDGLFYTTRACWAPMVPMTYTAPMQINKVLVDQIKETVRRILKAADIRYGAFNMEGFFTERGEFFVIEINARQGGNFLPLFLQRATGIDYNRLLVTTCVGDDSYLKNVMRSECSRRYVAMHSVYNEKEGAYDGLIIDPTIADYVTDVRELLKAGDHVEACIDGTSIVASVDMEFDSLEKLYEISPRVMDNIHVKLKHG